MTWIQHVLTEGRKKTGQHIEQPFGTEIVVHQVMQVNVVQKHMQKFCNLSQRTCALLILCPPTCRILFSYWKTLKHVLYRHILQIEVLLNESKPASFCTEHVFKEKRKKNLKRQTGKSGFMKAEKCVAARLTQCCTGEIICTDHKVNTPPFMLPLTARILTSEHEYICFHHLWICAYTCALQALSVSYSHSLQTESVSRYRTPELFWPPLPIHTILVSGLHVEVCKPRSPGHIPPALWHSAPGFK